MVFDARTDLREAAVSMAAVSMLAACTVTCLETDIGKAVSYNNEISVFGTRAQQNRWVENARLSLFLQERIQSSGIGKLARKYGLQCSSDARELHGLLCLHRNGCRGDP